MIDLQMFRDKMRKVERKGKKVTMRMKMTKEEKKPQKRNSAMMVIIIRFSKETLSLMPHTSHIIAC